MIGQLLIMLMQAHSKFEPLIPAMWALQAELAGLEPLVRVLTFMLQELDALAAEPPCPLH